MANKKEKNSNTGLITLLVCGLIAVALIVGCVFYPEQTFGLFFK